MKVTFESALWWPIVANFNLNYRRNFKQHLNFILEMKIKSKFTLQVDIQIQIDLYLLAFCFSFVVLVDSNFIDHVQCN